MRKNTPPTRGALVRTAAAFVLAVRGHDILEQKRQVLMMELSRRIREAAGIQRTTRQVFEKAYAGLQTAGLSLGLDTVEDIARSVPETTSFTVRLHAVMGAEIPDVDPVSPDPFPCYSWYGTSASLDMAFFRAREVCSLIARLAEVETSVYRLAVHIRKTLRRVNALEKVVIPDLRADMARIAGALEEAEREDFVRMKTAQKLLRRKEAERKQ